MRTEQQFLDEYSASHQNPLNQIIHMVCVPAIYAATLGLFWLVPVGRFVPGVPEAIAPFINLATLFFIPAFFFYARLSPWALATGVVWTLVSLAAIVGIQSAGLPLGWIALAAWVIAWAVQFYGHKVEGAKPSFADDLVFLLIGPLYVQQKLQRLLTTGSIHPQLH